ncbi:MAG: hypothetical protein NVS3B20_18620 [Polyangiales bacterium]
MLNLADCEEHLGHLADALEQFEHAVEMLDKADDRIAYTQMRILKLAPRVPRLRLKEGVEPAVVALDGIELGPAAFGIPLPVNPGVHTIVVRARGRRDRSQTVTIAEAASLDVEVVIGEPAPTTLVASPPSAAGVPPALAPVKALAAPGSRTAAWALMAVGGAGLVVTSVAGIMALHAANSVRDRCPNHVCPMQSDLDTARNGKTYSTISTVGLGVGVLGVAAATFLFLRPNRSGQRSADVVPIVGPSMVGFACIKTFE